MINVVKKKYRVQRKLKESTRVKEKRSLKIAGNILFKNSLSKRTSIIITLLTRLHVSYIYNRNKKICM